MPRACCSENITDSEPAIESNKPEVG